MTRPGPPRPHAVLFDCDGLLLDTAGPWEAAERLVVADHGGVWRDDIRTMVHGISLPGAAQILADQVPDGAGADVLLADLLAAFRTVVTEQGVSPMPGAVELVRELSGWRPLAVASNMPQDLLEWAVDAASLHGFFDVVTGAAPELEPKPAPDIYLAACALLGIEPGLGHALEDSQTGVDAAVAAGLAITGVNPSVELHGCPQVASLHDVDRPRLGEAPSRG